MTHVKGKELPFEKQKEMLVEAVALKLPLLYKSLIETYGDKNGKRMYEELFETNFKTRAARFKGKNIVDIMMAEVEVFPTFGWEIWIEKKQEINNVFCFEHLVKCPHLAATKKYNLPDPCPIICDLDCIMGDKYKVAKWERISHVPSGDKECCFKITPFD